MFDADSDGSLSRDEFWAGWMSSMDDDHDDHGTGGDAEMVCYDMSTHTVDTAYDNQGLDCESAGPMWTAASGGSDHGDHEDHMSHSVTALFPDNTSMESRNGA